ncbi:MAG: hypothetical protein HQ485_14030 [Acidobacteria bacterium]|nr:hypothetical protein [Acidobacteriota bacterium]
MKSHRVHSHWRFSLPLRHLLQLPLEQRLQWLFWHDRFEVAECVTFQSAVEMDAELERFVAATHPDSAWLLRADRSWRQSRDVIRRAWMAARRRGVAIVKRS